MHPNQLYKNPKKSAKIAGLRYVSDQQPGVRRKRWGRGFSYIDVDGKRIKDKKRRAEFEALVIPPSWREVWICCDENGHLRATGRDLKNRKQYRYHPEWVSLRNQLKFDRLIPFAQKLPVLRAKTQATLAKATPNKRLSRDIVIAATVQLLDETFIRIGNTQYAEANQSHGLTTLTTSHIKISAGSIALKFVGKSGVDRKITLQDAKLAKVLKRCKEIPGQDLFQYIDDEGDRHVIESGDVNDYLSEVMDDSFTAKDFRTWGGTVTAANALYQVAVQDAEDTSKQTANKQTANKQNGSKQAKKESDDSGNSAPDDNSVIVDAVKVAAKQLGNRPATCRKYYIHPRIFEIYRAGELLDAIAHTPIKKPDLLKYLQPEEQRTFSILKASWEKQMS